MNPVPNNNNKNKRITIEEVKNGYTVNVSSNDTDLYHYETIISPDVVGVIKIAEDFLNNN